MADNIRTTVEELRKLISVDNVIGTPIETEDKVLIPVMRMGVGFGAGENILGREGNDAAGAGAGFGVSFHGSTSFSGADFSIVLLK